MKYAVIGAGISGLSIARILQEKGHTVKIFEAVSRPGGLIKCTIVQGNLYHMVGGHVFNSKRQDVLRWFWTLFDREHDFLPAVRHAAISLENGVMVDYPIENHLSQFPDATREIIVSELLELYHTPPPEPKNLGEFFITRFGKTLSEVYFHPYNNKVWRQDINNIALDWLEGKLPMPSVTEILLNNIGKVDECKMVHSTFYYAKAGGSQFIADTLAQGLDIAYDSRIDELRRENNQWIVQGESFDRIIYTGNVRELPSKLSNNELSAFTDEIESLKSHGTTSVLCSITPNTFSWIYLPSPRLGSHRIICTGNFSPSNNGEGHMTATIEFSEQMHEEEIRAQLAHMPLKPQYLAHHWEPCTYPVQDEFSRELVSHIKEALDSLGFYLHGRFAEWEYYNMDAAIGASLDLSVRL